MQSRLGKCWFRLLILVICVLFTGCSKNDMPFPRCISADYFGPEPIAIGAHFPIGHDAFFPEGESGEPIDPETGEINYGFHPNQVVKWKDTGLETNGDSLVVRVNGAWTSWSNSNKKESQNSYSLESLEQLKYATKFERGEGDNSLPDFHLVCNDYKPSIQKFSSKPKASCTVKCKCINEDDNREKRGAPCWFTNGHGAYLLFKRPSDSSPNENLKSMRNPESPTIHLGYNSVAEDGSGLFTLDRDNTTLQDRNCNTVRLEKGWKIYVKILDRYYLDNAGGYSFEFLSGVQKPSNFGFFDYVYNYLKCVLLINENCKKHFDSNDPAAAQAMFQNIAEKSTSFHNFVLSLLVLFIVISSLLYLFGIIRETKHDMLIRMMKITLVIVLISPGSFRFFYDHFLVLFVKGLEQLISIITNFAPNMNTGGNSNVAQGNEAKLFSFMEDMFNKFFAYSVWKKFAAFLHYQMWASLLMIPAIFIGIVLYFLLCMYAYIIFLSGFMGIAFLVAIMPLFLISILFSPLKSLFEGWIKFCISFCLQSIMIFTLLSLLAAMIMNTFYRQLGFTVCYNKWLEIRLLCLGDSCGFDKQYFGWTPGQIFVPYTIGEASPLNVDKSIEGIEKISREGGTIKFTGGAGYIPLPPDYIEKGFRYIDYPFFNPIPGTKDNPADHYIAESDIVVDADCSEKDLVRLTNSLLHASEKADILLLIDNIDGKIKRRYCQSQQHEEECRNYEKIIDDYKKGIIQPNSKSEIKSLVQGIITQSVSCQSENFYDINQNYQENSDYQRVQDIQRGYLINAGEIFVLFLLSFLMFSLKEFVQQMGSSIAGGGYSVYNISSMYSKHSPSATAHGDPDASFVSQILYSGKSVVQDAIGGRLESVGSWVTHLPNRLAEEAANQLGKIPRVGGVLKYAIDVPRKLVGATIEATKFAISPKNDVDKLDKSDVDKLEEKIYRAFGVDEEKIAHRRIGEYLEYYKRYVGSHLGYTIEDAMKFTWEHGLDSIGINPAKGEKDGYQHNLLYRAKTYRREFLEKLHDYTIGRKREPKEDESSKENKPNQSNRKLGTEPETLKNTTEAIRVGEDRERQDNERNENIENDEES
ncbi:type IV secretion system protein [Wolbachia endosymbiont of Diaphorina citri]|jgi:Type IV secretory pathway, VirB6 components|uniref:type IV secretion system protein n=1 Tax=Wolbachia endosymbiont of Diaphorina citri TaxID=116598 RepID=UPI00037C4DE0|nr:type IV secretion system protein [Wolbachia endosymbiont of Diaphorina citri]QJT94632.1 type IV secretion system protein [Wolbachia endosymbiont of Diaphorina citri]QJT95871.1 type IV secretion system protein [Wolbachia endosymbiont of Diaphorina citri]QJT97233.1 type IV secretion system protein [Wolbachia endosymbiont of Diaphorina citri]QLK11529.1 type IV secretion system protein [Wolbachia endosymbiont of Diaphorina citri]QXY86938.1 type IV secretion system protein [Wolbachia endosymbion